MIGAGSRLDNLVQIGHNAILGRCCVIVAQAGISGSTVLEDFVRVGGGRLWPGIFGSVKVRKSERERHHFGCGCRRESAWKPCTANKGLLPTNCHAQEDGKGRGIKLQERFIKCMGISACEFRCCEGFRTPARARGATVIVPLPPFRSKWR